MVAGPGHDVASHLAPAAEGGAVLLPGGAGEVGDDPVGDATETGHDGVGQLVPRGADDEVLQDLVGDHGAHTGHVARLLTFPDPRRRSLEPDLVEDEPVVGSRSVERDLHAGHLPPPGALFLGVADRGAQRDDQGQVGGVAPDQAGAGCGLRQHRLLEVRRSVQRMDVHPVGDLAGGAQHPGVDGGDVDRWIGGVDRSRRPLGRQERHRSSPSNSRHDGDLIPVFDGGVEVIEKANVVAVDKTIQARGDASTGKTRIDKREFAFPIGQAQFGHQRRRLNNGRCDLLQRARD